jgi:glycosyltransferase involved in cell wall biosynthesis
MDLSVVIPAHNVAATLGDQLDALAAESWDGEWEIVVVDNCSTDGTAALVRDHAARNPRLGWCRRRSGKVRATPATSASKPRRPR